MRKLVTLLAFCLILFYFLSATEAPIAAALFFSAVYATIAGTVLTPQGHVALRRIWRNLRGGQQPG